MEKERKFMDLEQFGDITIAQYEDDFTRIIKYMLIYEADERIKAHKFLGVLKLRIQKALRNVSTWSYVEVVLQAMTIEAYLNYFNSIQGPSQQASNFRPSTGKKLDPKKPKFKPSKPCLKCGKQHPGRPFRKGQIAVITVGKKDISTGIFPKGDPFTITSISKDMCQEIIQSQSRWDSFKDQ